jgi:photosystem II stability/assembly factor-like uncharacterized protein
MFNQHYLIMRTTLSLLALCTLCTSALAQMSWHAISSGTDRELRSIQFVNDQIGYIGGDSTLLRTTDGGLTWTAVAIDTIPINAWQQLDIYDMHWFNENHGIIMSGIWSGAFETFDGGTSWVTVPFAHNGFCQTTAVHFIDQTTGFAGGAGCFEGHIIDRFANGTWAETTDPESWDPQSWISAIGFRDADLGLAGTANGTLLRTTDGGLTWDSVPNVAGDSAITDFIFHADGRIRATHRYGEAFGIMISTDDGLTWQYDNETSTFFYPKMNAAHIDGIGTTYLGGMETNSNINGVIFNDRGGFWNWDMVDEPVNDIASHSDSITFLVGDSGSIRVNIDPILLGLSTATEGIGFQLAPNPVHDLVRISGITGTIGYIRILDMAGREVAGVSAPTIATGIDVSHLRAGTYSLSVQTDMGIGTRMFIKD